jgi:hypothetical protein
VQKIYFDLGVPVSIPKYSMSLFGFSLYRKARLLQACVTCTPGGYVIYINERWNEWRWTKTYIKWKISLNFWIKYKLICNFCLNLIFKQNSQEK